MTSWRRAGIGSTLPIKTNTPVKNLHIRSRAVLLWIFEDLITIFRKLNIESSDSSCDAYILHLSVQKLEPQTESTLSCFL